MGSRIKVMTIVLRNPAEDRKRHDYCRRAVRGVLLLCSLIIPALMVQAAQQPRELFSAAQSTFEAGLKQHGEKKRLLMIKAAGQFRSLIETHGIENGNLYFNMGNAYFEAGEIGSAILGYRKAERLIPGSKDLQYNLEQARSRLNLPVSQPGWTERIVKGLVFWHYMMDYNLRRTLFFVAFAMVWVVLSVMIFRRHIFLRMALILMIAMTLGFGGSYLLSYHKLNLVKSGVVIRAETTPRKGPGLGYESFYDKPLPGGTEFVVQEELGEWLKASLNMGDEVCIQRSEAGLI